MNFTSSLAKEIADSTGLRNIKLTHFVGRYNDFFTCLEVQTDLSRALLRLRVLSLNEKTRSGLDKSLASRFSRINYSLLFEGNEIVVIVPANNGWVHRMREILDLITEYLDSHHIAADYASENMLIDQICTADRSDAVKLHRPKFALGFLGSFLGSSPGVIAWFISVLASNTAFLLGSPKVHANIFPRVFLAIIISCGSYWGFLLLSGATRKKSALYSAPITMILIYLVNRFSYAFLFYTNFSHLSMMSAFYRTKEYVNEFHLAKYYWLALLLSYLISMLTYCVLYRLREKFWKRSSIPKG